MHIYLNPPKTGTFIPVYRGYKMNSTDKIWACLCGSGDRIIMAFFSSKEEDADNDLKVEFCQAESHMKVHVTLAIADSIAYNINPRTVPVSEVLERVYTLYNYSVTPPTLSEEYSSKYVDTYHCRNVT